MTNALILSTIENEARVRDVDLATELGMARPTNIRKFIETHREELESFGGLHAVNANPGALGGRPTTEYHLNRNQALLACILSRTAKGREIRAEVIHRFNAYEGMVSTIRALTDPRARPGKPRILKFTFQWQEVRVLLIGDVPLFHGPDLVRLAYPGAGKWKHSVKNYLGAVANDDKVMITRTSLPFLFDGNPSAVLTLVTPQGVKDAFRAPKGVHRRKLKAWLEGSVLPALEARMQLAA